MLRWYVAPFVLACACSIRPFAGADEATGLEEALVAKESHPQQTRQQVSSWSPFSRWRWFNPVLSLHGDQIDEESSAATAAANGLRVPSGSEGAAPTAEGDDSMLSLVLLLDKEEEEERDGGKGKTLAASKEISKTPVAAPPLSPLAKRSRAVCANQGQGRCRRGQVSMIPANQVRQDWEDDYASVPDVLIQFSQKQAEETACNDLSVQLFQVDLKEHYLEPVWVREIVHLGMCPSKLQTRNFGKDVFPSSIVETKCLCHNQPCSNLGGDFRCQAIRRPIRTWVRHMEKFMPMQEMVTVGCVCVQRTSPEGKYFEPALQS